MKKKVLVFATAKQGSQEGNQLNEAIKYSKEGEDVLYLMCGNCLGGCRLENPLFDKSICKQCEKLFYKRAVKYLPSEVKIKSINDYWNPEIEKEVKGVTLPSDSVESIKSFCFHGVEAGYGAMSTYISLTRNLEPKLSDEVLDYLHELLRQQIRLTLILEKVLDIFPAELILFHNGRFAHYKPLLGVARTKNIPFICTEHFIWPDGSVQKNYISNGIPHSTKALDALYREFWSGKDPVKRVEIGKQFFENRRYGKYAGDKIYVSDQEEGRLPEDVDRSKENIVIFNSSEDEYCAIDKEVDDAALFESQLIGLKCILNKYENDRDKHFYLRVHPNLKGIKYSYHTELYNLKYDNLTIIPADSSVSSYALLDIADKVIVFGSTMGIEAAYWGKPTINLAYALYSLMDVVYNPQSVDELWSYIDNRNLTPKDANNALPYGFYYMSNEHENYEYINNGVYRYKILGHVMSVPRYCKILGSNYLYLILSESFKRARNYFHLGKFAKVPV